MAMILSGCGLFHNDAGNLRRISRPRLHQRKLPLPKIDLGLLRNEHLGFAPRDPARPVTKFERRALAAGRTIHDLAYRRSEPVQREGSNTAGST